MVGGSGLFSRRGSGALLLGGVAGVAIAFAAAVSSQTAQAQTLPVGAMVVDGDAAFASSPNRLEVRQSSPAAIISWNTFSIGAPDSVHFDNGAGATLNRVRGNIASRIDGSLTATGSVYLVNPAGIAVGTTGRIKTGGSFVGSTLGLSDEEFARAARGQSYTLSGDSGAAVVNAGRIGSSGGDVALVGRHVENSGDIDAPSGTAALAAGSEVLVQDRALDDGRFVVKVGGEGARVHNSGNLRAVEVELRANGGNVYALAGNRGGVVAATGSATRGGRVFLTAGDAGTVEVTQRVSARRTAAEPGRAIGKHARGGEIRVSGRNVTVAGTLDASGRALSVLPPARPSALDGDGGLVIVTGDALTLADTARVDVGGGRGGVALIGGDFQGGGTAGDYVPEKVARARTLSVTDGARIAADGAADGGRIVLWSDERTNFAGHISAESTTGRGGDAEVSGKAVLSFNGTADLRGPLGAGTLLLDPYNLQIVAGSGGDFTSSASVSTLGVTKLTDALATANVTVKTGGAAGDGAGNGDITVSAGIVWKAATTLTLQAHRNIVIDAGITAKMGGLTLIAAAGDVAAPSITTGAGGAIDVGKFYLQSGAWVQNAAALPAFRVGDFGLATDSDLAPSVTFLRAMAGTGADAANAYAIGDVYGLQGMATLRDKHYKLARNIDAAGTADWYGGKGFLPIGRNVASKYFTGSFDGFGYVISGLTIDRSSASYVGLFGRVSGSQISNIGLVGGAVTGSGSVGGLVGYLDGGASITNAYSTGAVTGSNYVGGLVGTRYGTGNITNAYATGAVNGGGWTGGLVGSHNGGLIVRSYATGTVTGNKSVGGLVGEVDQSGRIRDSYATGAVTGTGYNVGGLVGETISVGTSIIRAYATGSVTGGGYVGGLVGAMEGSISNSYATGAVTSGGSYAGGLVGGLGGSVTSAYASGAVKGSSEVGGLAGRQSGTINSAYATGAVTGSQDSVGGLVGYQLGAISNAYSTGAVTGANSVGGLVGYRSSGDIGTVYASGAVTGSGSNVGGLLGYRATGGTVTSAYWDTDSTGVSKGSGVGVVTGMTGVRSRTGTVNAFNMATYTGFTSGSRWYVIEGQTRPMLRMTLDEIGKTYDAAGVLVADTYTIRSPEALQLVDMYKAAAGSGKTFVLGGNLDMSGILDTAGSVWRTAVTKDASNTYGFVPIGVGSTFDGTLDGRGHAINNLTIYRPGQDMVGVVSNLSASGVVTNIGVQDGTVTGRTYIGGLVGYADGTISNAWTTGTVAEGPGSGFIGGLVGYLGGSIADSWAAGRVNSPGANYVGGLVGGMRSSATIERAWSSSAVSGGMGVGGLVGDQQDADITDVYSTGTVTGGSYVGGLSGFVQSGDIIRGYASGRVSGGSYVGGIAGLRSSNGNIIGFWDSDTTQQANAFGDKQGNGMSDKYVAVTALNAYTKNNYTDSGWDFTNTWYMVDGELRPMLRMTLDQTGRTWDTFGDAVPGTYTIRSAEQLQLVRAHTDKGGSYTAGKTYTLLNDIDFAAALADSGVWRTAATKTTKDLYGFVPIGANPSGSLFNGKFDGQRHVIRGLTISRPQASDGGGLFGRVTGATIQNIGLEGGIVVGTSSTGSLAGGLDSDSSVFNAWSSVDVTGAGFVGGLIGSTGAGVTLTNVSTSGAVVGNDVVGGLVGAVSGVGGARIVGASSTGSVTGGGRVGGLLGSVASGSVIINARASGDVTQTKSSTNMLGGLIGVVYFSAGTPTSIINTYASGKVTGPVVGGGLIGNAASATGTLDITASFWDTANSGKSNAIGYINPGATVVSDITGLTTDQLANTAYFMEVAGAKGWDFENVWAPPGDGYKPELYALSKVVRVHASKNVNQRYGGAGAWAGGGTPNATVYGAGRFMYGETNYGKHSSFGSSVTAATAGLTQGDYIGAEITGLTNAGSNGFRFIYTAGLSLTKGVLTITGNSASSRAYDTTTIIGGAQVTAGILSGVAGGDDVQIGTVAASYDNANAGTGKTITWRYTLTGADAYKYDIIDFTTTSGVVTKASLTVTAADASKTYDAAAWNGGNGVSYSAFAGSEDASSLGGALTFSGTSQGAKNAGNYAIKAGGLTSGNYDISYIDGALSIGRASLTVTAADASKTYDAAAWNGGNGVTYSAFAGSEDASNLGGALTFSGTSQGAKNAGNYAIKAGGLTSGNYDISYIDGALSIGRAALAINPVAGQQAKIGDKAFRIAFDAVGWKGDDGVSLISGALDYDGASVGRRAINLGSISAGANYIVALVAGATIEVISNAIPEPGTNPPDPGQNPGSGSGENPGSGGIPGPGGNPNPEPNPNPNPNPGISPRPGAADPQPVQPGGGTGGNTGGHAGVPGGTPSPVVPGLSEGETGSPAPGAIVISNESRNSTGREAIAAQISHSLQAFPFDVSAEVTANSKSGNETSSEIIRGTAGGLDLAALYKLGDCDAIADSGVADEFRPSHISVEPISERLNLGRIYACH